MEAVNLPIGTVTFLFTDIEGPTRLLERLREGYTRVLADQRRILRDGFARWNGHEIDTQGDSFFKSFSRAIDAIGFVIETQPQLAAQAWLDLAEAFDRTDRPHRAEYTRRKLAGLQTVLEQEAAT